MHVSRLLPWLVCLPLIAAVSPASAEEPLRATVLHIDGDEIVIDVGRAQLAGTQDLTVYRTLEVRHPITHKVLRDRFVIGALQVEQAGDSLSVTKLKGTPTHPLAVGDAVELPAQPVVAVQAVQAATPPAQVSTPAAPTADQTQTAAASAPAAAGTAAVSTTEREMLSYWQATLTQPPAMRVRFYTRYLQLRPSSPYRTFLLGEIRYLSALDAKLSHPVVINNGIFGGSAPTAPAPDPAVKMLPITGAEAGHEVDVAALVVADKGVHSLLLHVRPLESSTYHSAVMQLDARGHARARIAKDLVLAPGFAYFVEVIDGSGEPYAAIGSAGTPKIVVVRGPAPKRKQVERATRVRFSSELVSFDKTSGRDYFLLNEGDFLYRVRRGPLYGVRMGYGNLRGEGGTVQQLDVQGLDPQPAGFSYGFFEAELALHKLFGIAFRGTVGLGRPDDPASQRNGITGGFQVRTRIGEAEGTRLILAGEVMPEIGQRAYIGLSWEAIERVPMATEIVVTDQPVNSDELAVRLIYELGYRFSDRVSVALRPSYQLRTIRHAGPGIGMAATFDW